MQKSEKEIPNVVFSFRYYDTTKESKWCMSCWDNKYIKPALAAFKEINNNKRTTLKGHSWHFHPVDWKSTIYKNGFSDTLLKNMEAWQVALPSVNTTLTRIFGVVQNNIFYIVWFDLNHEICPTKNS
jgi:hypothetical protein